MNYYISHIYWSQIKQSLCYTNKTNDKHSYVFPKYMQFNIITIYRFLLFKLKLAAIFRRHIFCKHFQFC